MTFLATWAGRAFLSWGTHMAVLLTGAWSALLTIRRALAHLTSGAGLANLLVLSGIANATNGTRHTFLAIADDVAALLLILHATVFISGLGVTLFSRAGHHPTDIFSIRNLAIAGIRHIFRTITGFGLLVDQLGVFLALALEKKLIKAGQIICISEPAYDRAQTDHNNSGATTRLLV
ncbi:MAG: hypothetical protein A2X86_00660 [Bdellovibrionales bacterium GWA2_49_15]|nr:MAG: hypothetical protein A2X86_00660 [Bdellovibrionales bacterium GWA2_49_15]HAZ13224.1 hypothetical protein [Bdellovibrionales bacterium]